MLVVRATGRELELEELELEIEFKLDTGTGTVLWTTVVNGKGLAFAIAAFATAGESFLFCGRPFGFGFLMRT